MLRVGHATANGTMVRRGAEKAPPAAGPRTPRWVLAVIGAAVVAVGAAGWWGLTSRPSEFGEPAAVGEVVAVPGGTLVVDAVRPEVMTHAAMPGMQMPDMVREGYRRFTVEATLIADGSGVLRYAPERFRVGGPGVASAAPRRAAGVRTVVAPGEALSVSVVFESPDGAETVWLMYDGAARPVLLRGDLGAHAHGAPSTGAIPSAQVGIAGGRFVTREVTVHAGQAVRWVNEEVQPHTVVIADLGQTSTVLQRGEGFSARFPTSGVFRVTCSIHPGMGGTIVVIDP